MQPDNTHELRVALEAMVGIFDTPISRRKLNSEYAKEAREMARAALSPKDESNDD